MVAISFHEQTFNTFPPIYQGIFWTSPFPEPVELGVHGALPVFAMQRTKNLHILYINSCTPKFSGHPLALTSKDHVI
jgi:hypothetical protein